MNDLLSIYLRIVLAVRSKLITLALFSTDIRKNTNHPMSSSNTSNTSLTWVSAVNNTYKVYLLFLCRHGFCKKYFSSPPRYFIKIAYLVRSRIEDHCTRLSLEEHTGTFLLSVKYFLYVCCSLAKTVSFYICDPVWFCLVLSNSARLMPSGTMGFNANVQAIPFFRPDVPKSTPFFLYMLKLTIFSF